MPAAKGGARVLYWFRTDLRLHDSPALHAALGIKNVETVIPLWCWDVNYIFKHRVGLNRFRFLLESMSDLSSRITDLNPKSQLFVVRGDPAELLPELFKRWNVTHLAFEADPNAYARRRDDAVRKAAEKAGVEIVEKPGHHLYDIREVVKKNGGKPPMSMKAYQSAISSLGSPAKPLPAPDSLPDPVPPSGPAKDRASIISALRKELDGLPHYAARSDYAEVDYNAASFGGQRVADEKKGRVTCYDTLVGPDEDVKKEELENLFSVPTLASLGMDPAAVGAAPESVVPGGEAEALRRLEKLCRRSEYVATFSKPSTSPGKDTTEPSTTLLSPFLKFGCLSVRKLWWDVAEAAKGYKGKGKTTIPENLEGQLLFRDMYAAGELAIGDAYAGIRGNPNSRFMDWYLPTAYDKEGNRIEPRPKGDEVSEARLEAWRNGTTGFPWIDALVRQLRLTGWIHHLGRHSLAAFLTRGQCWISWERGAEFFEEMLLDADFCSNPGNWMWLSCSAYFHQFFRVYGLATFPAKYDKTGALVRKYIPELKNYPDKYIYTPHLAPLDVQKKAGCVIGKDYPAPILDEKEEKQHCLDRCKAAFDAKMYGTSKEVLAGKAEGMLRKKHGVPDPVAPEGGFQKQPQGSKVPEWAKAGAKGAKKSEKDREMSGSAADRGEDEEGESCDDDEEEGVEEEEKPKKKGAAAESGAASETKKRGAKAAKEEDDGEGDEKKSKRRRK